MKVTSRLACLLLAVSCYATAVAAQGPPNGLNVNVINTPLPVQGTVSVTGPLSITGTVAIRDVENPARQPFTRDVILSTSNGTLGANGSLTVPAGKRLVIEFVSFNGNWPAGQATVRLFVGVCNASAGACPTNFFFATNYQTTDFGGETFFVASASTRLYADPGTEVSIAVRRNASTGTGLASVAISGYLVDVN